MEVKKKDMKKTGWKRCLEKDYYTKEFKFKNQTGIVSLSHLKKIQEPLTIHYDFGDLLIADTNYYHLQFAFKNELFWLTAMYDDKMNLIELYFDITDSNHFDDTNNPYFYDMFLDIVVTNDGKIHILDEDELQEALNNNIITLEQYNKARNTMKDLYTYLQKNKDELISFCNETLKEMIQKEKKMNLYLKELKYLRNLPYNENGFYNPAEPEDLVNEETFKNWLSSKILESNGINLKEGYVPQTIYWVMDGDRIVGVGKLRHYLTEKLQEHGGHIGLGIASDCRTKGVGTAALKLLLIEASEKGIEEVLLTNNEDNYASRKMVEKCGGVLEKIKDGHCKYWINLKTKNYKK